MTIPEKVLVGNRSGWGNRPPVPEIATHLALSVLVVALAFFLRIYRLPEVPFGWHPDEATKGLLRQAEALREDLQRFQI